MTHCNQCNGQLARLGKLGDRTHYRCINCGWEQSEVVDNFELEEELEDEENGFPFYPDPEEEHSNYYDNDQDFEMGF